MASSPPKLRRRTGAAGKARNVSDHPCRDKNVKPVDAAWIHIDRLREMLDAGPRCYDRLDFVNVNDDVIDQLFVTERIRKLWKEILYPPPKHRRTVSQIKAWFELSKEGKRQTINEASNIDVIFTVVPMSANTFSRRSGI